MSQNYGGRVVAILVVLFVGLFGIPFMGPGIFVPAKLFNPHAPWSEKTNLKPGIDIAGGTSLLYEIKIPSQGAPPGGNLAEQVAESLKKRVDPQGVRNLVWRPQGNTRLEIQLPRSAKSDQVAGKRQEYIAAQGQLNKLNVNSADVITAVEKMTGPARDKKLADLASGSESRSKSYRQMAELYDRIQALQKQIDEATAAKDTAKQNAAGDAWALATKDYEKLKSSLGEGGVKADDIQAILDGEDAKARDQKLADLKKQFADFPRRVAAIDAFAKAYGEYKDLNGAIDDSADLKRLLKGSGVLEYHILADNTSPASEVQAMIERLKAKGPAAEAGDKFRWYPVDRPEEFPLNGAGYAQDYNQRRYVLASIIPRDSMVHSQTSPAWALQRAYPSQNQSGQKVVGFEFDPQGAALFSKLTGDHVPIGEHRFALAITLDDKIISAPSINSQIGGSGIIEGGKAGYSDADLTYLISTLNAGSLPAQLADEPISERIISPQLGLDNLQKGLVASLIGLVVVAVFLIGYYYVAGIVAFFAVVMNLIIILGILSMFGATFTLPSIAGIILTVGTAVDANVLVFERLREEQHRGLSLKMALNNAYGKAWHAIVDSNMTTAITSVFLYWLGSEEVKGFGLTLLIGICSSLFTALFVTRTIFGILITRFGLKDLRSLPTTYPKWDKLLRPNIDWMSYIWPFIIFSAIFILIGLSAFVTQKRNMFDIEFASGTSVQFELNTKMTREQIVEAIEKQNKADRDNPPIPSPSVVSINNSDVNYEVVTPNERASVVRDAVINALKGKLKIDMPSKYDGADQQPAQVMNKLILPITKKALQVDKIDISDASSYVGGAAIVLHNIDPPISPNEIHARLDRAALQPGSENVTKGWNSVDVVRLDDNSSADPANQPVANAVVLVSDPKFPYEKSPADWTAHVADPIWRLISDGVNRPAQLQRISNFNPQVAGDAQRSALAATVLSILVIMIYIWVRFGNLKYGTATIVALVHDTLATVGAIGLSHYVANTFVGDLLMLEPFRINLTLVAAILTVMGYSMIDTIVVFDRIREIRGKYGHVSRQVINDGINQTLSRTLLTAGTTLIMVGVMYICGGPGIHGFTFVLLIGILVGTYSSIAIAAPILLIGSAPQESPQTGTGTTSRKSAIGQTQRVGV